MRILEQIIKDFPSSRPGVAPGLALGTGALHLGKVPASEHLSGILQVYLSVHQMRTSCNRGGYYRSCCDNSRSG